MAKPGLEGLTPFFLLEGQQNIQTPDNNVKRDLESQQNVIKAKTGSMLQKHANNKKMDSSGSNVRQVSRSISSPASGTFGCNSGMAKLEIIIEAALRVTKSRSAAT